MAVRRPPPRPQAPPPSSRLASLFFAIGCLVVLSVTFAVGVAVGRRWPGGLPGFSGSAAVTAPTGEREVARRGETRSLDKSKVTTDAPPALTFYHELTAPLASTAAPARPAAKRETKTVEAAKPAPRPAETLKPVGSDAAEASRRERMTSTASASPSGTSASPSGTSASPASVSAPRFTVQVGSFKTRAQADAFRARLAESGHEADVAEGAAAGVTQYRVRVGTFTSRAAAAEAASRLQAERQLGTYVTTR